MRTLLLLLVTAVLAGACNMVCVKGTGDLERRTLTVPAFTGISVEGSIEVHVARGDVQQVEVEGQSAVIDLVTTQVRDGVWRIRTSSCYDTDKPFIVHLRVPRLERIAVEGSGNVVADSVFGAGRTVLEVSGSGDLTAHAVNEERLMVSVAGSGNMTVTGTAVHFDAQVMGSGNLLATGLNAAHAEVAVMGSGDVNLTAVEQLDASVQGSGNVHYRGQPRVTTRIQGSGTVAPIE